MALDTLRCWKCGSTSVAERRMLVGRVRTTAEQLERGDEDRNAYQDFLVCLAEQCGYRWRRHQDRYLKQVVFRRERNEKIADLAVRFARARQSCFVFVQLVEHAEALGLMVKGAFSAAGLDPAKCQVVHGELDHNDAVKAALVRREVLAVIGTTVWGEGTDIPNLNWVVNGAAGLPGTALEQLVGRALRKAPGKRRAGFVDFLDEHDKSFASRSARRLDFLRQKGFDPLRLRPSPSRRGGRKYRR